MTSYEKVPLNEFQDKFFVFTELSSVALGACVISVSDEFFAEAANLLKIEPAPSLKGQFGPNGALFSGWETRRHNPTHDWCIIKLGTTGRIVGYDVDTSHFNGNEAPEVSVDALLGDPKERPSVDDSRWTEILPKVTLGPNSRHLFKIPETAKYNFVKLNIYPDGGIARFRVYGDVVAETPKDFVQPFDLAHVFAGGRVDFTSNQHFGIGSNLILPGRGKDMGDGWETKRSRQKDHKDWAILKLGTAGILENIEIDTAHFKGNYPESCEVHGLFAPNGVDWHTQKDDLLQWTLLLPRTKLGSNRQHYFQLCDVARKAYTHVKITIYPDGGIKRIRVIGRRATGSIVGSVDLLSSAVAEGIVKATPDLADIKTIPAVPLIPELFAPYGQVLQAYFSHSTAPGGVRVTPANGGTANKFHKLSLLHSTYPEGCNATAGISIYRCQPLQNVSPDGTTPLVVMERHPFTNQAFIPMGRGTGEEAITDPADKYLVVVAKNGLDDKPDMESLRAFVASTGQGIVYDAGIWHLPMTVLGKPLDLACVETQIGDGSVADCEILELEPLFGTIRLELPPNQA
ncbi:allantoicase [Amanita muscaria]